MAVTVERKGAAMGTRSLTILAGRDGEIAVMYRQMDGYPTGHGVELRDFLFGKRITNGFGMDDNIETAFNGPDCMAAAIVARFKIEAGIGGIYLYPAGTRDAGEEYRYTVYTVAEEPSIYLTVESAYGEKWRTLFDGPVESFDPEAAEGADR